MFSPVDALSRCLHILGAITLFGGALFLRYVLLPAAEELPENDQNKIKTGTTKRWKYIVHGCITVLIFTGFYNYLVVMLPKHKGDGQYHMWMGIKILLAFIVFFIVSVLPGRVRMFENMRKHMKYWLGVTITLSTIIVAIAGTLKVRGTLPAPQAAPQAEQPAAPAAQPAPEGADESLDDAASS